MTVAIIGAGVSGLGAALTLARDGHDVVLLERDATPLPQSADDAFDWKRRGAPQVRHSHAFLARVRNLLRDRLPDVREALLAAGATEIRWADMLGETIEDKTPQRGDEDLVMLACRRTTFEWVLRKAALATDRVDLRDGVTVTGLMHDKSRITGVHTNHGDIAADVVLDAAGRPSHLPQMLADLGTKLTERKSATGIVYLSRFYRLRDNATEPSPQPFNGADLGYMKYAVFRGDNRTFSVTLAYATDDADMRRLREKGNFDAAVALVDNIRPWVDEDTSEPISGVHYMGGLINRVRNFVVDSEPIALGLHALGDSSVCTNPLYGRGCSLGMLHGVLFADALREHGDDQRQLALAFHEATQSELIPWYVAAVAQDKASMAIQRGEKLSDFDAYMRTIVIDGLFPASRVDANVSRAWMRSFNLLTTPDAALSDPKVMARVMEFWNARDQRKPEPIAGPEKETLLAAIAAAS
jgi:2-polyprenyl-6-methoxyphenol hydroxylase-like FAD-dependent oxidoreductase